MGLWLIAQKSSAGHCLPTPLCPGHGLYPVPLSLPGAVGAGEFVSPCESGDNLGEPSALEEQRGPLPLNKTLFLGYAFLLTMATTSDKLASRSKLPDGPAGSSEEEEGKALKKPWGLSHPCARPSFPFTLQTMSRRQGPWQRESESEKTSLTPLALWFIDYSQRTSVSSSSK